MSTILLLADNSFTRRLLFEVLSEDGHTTFVARSAHEVFAILRAHAEIDLLFVDIQDPESLDVDGLTQEAKRLRPAISVLHATGAEAHSLNQSAHIAILQKPCGPQRVRTKVRAIAAERPTASPE